MTLLRSPLLAIATALACTTINLSAVHAQAQTPVDANPVPAPAAIAQPAVPVAPAAGQPTAAPSSIGANSTTVADFNQAARDPRTLNPLLIPTDNEIQSGLDAGRAIGQTKNDFIDLLEPARRGFEFRNGGMFGERRRATGVAVWVTPAIEARWRGFVEARDYAGDEGREADLNAVRTLVTSPQRTLTFIVELGDVIAGRPEDPSQAEIEAGYTSLAGTRFVLSDDRNDNYDPANVAASPHLMRRQDFYDAIAGGSDRLTAAAAFGPAPADSHRLVTRRKPYGDYAAFYIVTFNAFNPDGGARVNRDVHQLTLRIVTPEAARTAVFELAKMP